MDLLDLLFDWHAAFAYGTDVEPSLSALPYPTHLVRTVIEQQKRVFSLLLPLQAAL